MSELREKVARAIYDADDPQSGDTVGVVIWASDHLFFDEVEGESIEETAWRASKPVCEAAADAAIAAVLEAMQEPSPAMLDRFVSRALCVSVSGEGGWSEYGRNQWAAMLEGFRQDHGLPRG